MAFHSSTQRQYWIFSSAKVLGGLRAASNAEARERITKIHSDVSAEAALTVEEEVCDEAHNRSTMIPLPVILIIFVVFLYFHSQPPARMSTAGPLARVL